MRSLFARDLPHKERARPAEAEKTRGKNANARLGQYRAGVVGLVVKTTLVARTGFEPMTFGL